MKFRKILSASIVGTSTMTLFSYFLSGKLNKQFIEPELLNKLMSDNRVIRYLKKNSLPGWFIHYLIGMLFAMSSHFIWKASKINPSLQSGALLGLMYGLIGISGWHLIFKLHPNPPAVNLQEYYLHLLAAHLLYGCGTAFAYKHPDDHNKLSDIP